MGEFNWGIVVVPSIPLVLILVLLLLKGWEFLHETKPQYWGWRNYIHFLFGWRY